jgi:hypothetical protein
MTQDKEKTVSMDVAYRIWSAHREIEVAQKLYDEMKGELERGANPTPRDVFGRRRNLSLGVPSGNDGQRLFDVSPRLALSIIEAHIAEKRHELTEASIAARVEMGRA